MMMMMMVPLPSSPKIITVLQYDYIPNVLEARGPYREEHLLLAQSMIDAGTCLAGGPYQNTNWNDNTNTNNTKNDTNIPVGAYFWFTSPQAAADFVAQDPYVAAGIVTQHSIHEWNVVVAAEAARQQQNDSEWGNIKEWVVVVVEIYSVTKKWKDYAPATLGLENNTYAVEVDFI